MRSIFTVVTQLIQSISNVPATGTVLGGVEELARAVLVDGATKVPFVRPLELAKVAYKWKYAVCLQKIER